MNRVVALLLLGLLVLGSCRTCPIVSCHTRKKHLHGGVMYRGQPLWKKQNPAVGEKIKVHNQGQSKRANNKSKSL
jgi:hypothetical protein